MSLLKSNSVQIGQSTTGTNNFTLSVPSSPDGTIKLARGNSGATTQDILSVNASGAVTLTNGGTITLGAVQNSTSGTAIDFTGIPSWAKRITVMFDGVSTNGTALLQIQIGSGSFVSTGYNGFYYLNGTYRGSFSSAFIIRGLSASGSINYGSATLNLIGSNTWVETGVILDSGFSQDSTQSAGAIALSGSLDRVRITTVGASDTFDLGSINIMYEG